MQQCMMQQRSMASMCSPLLGCRPRGIAAFSSPQHKRAGRRQAAVRAALDPQAALAVTQQGVAFAAVVGAEAAYIGLSTPATEKGRPVVTTTVGGVGAVVVAIALLGQGSPLDSIGSGLGFAASAYLMAYYLQRAKETDLGTDFPGPKAWPAVMALISFFSLAAFLQALLPSLGLK